MRLICLIFALFLFIPAFAQQILVWDIVSDTSQAGIETTTILQDNEYSVVYCTNPDTAIQNTPPTMFVFPGIGEYGQGSLLSQNVLDVIIQHKQQGKNLIIFGHKNLPYNLWSFLGFDEMTWQPFAADSLTGVTGTFLEDINIYYPEEEIFGNPFVGIYAIAGPNRTRVIIETYYDELHIMPHGVYYENSVTINMDPSLIVEEEGYSTKEEFILAILQGYFDFYPTSIDEDESVPLHFTLSQNYPNPFNASTLISYSLDIPSHVKLDIFDLLGQHIETLVDEKQITGLHQVSWNPDIASGIYFYRIKIDDENAKTMKMCLLK